MTPSVYVLIGLAAGVLSGMFGIGGGVLIVPALVFFAKMPIKTATGTSLGVFVLPVAILGALTYYRAGNLNPRVSLLVASGLVLGSFVGARITNSLSPQVVQRLFAVFLVVMAARLWLKAGG